MYIDDMILLTGSSAGAQLGLAQGLAGGTTVEGVDVGAEGAAGTLSVVGAGELALAGAGEHLLQVLFVS